MFQIKSEVYTKPDSSHIKEVRIDLTISDVGESNPSFKKDFKVKLISCDVSENGLIEFKYLLSEEDHVLFDHLRDYVYDLIKGHFHVHEHHIYFTSVKKGFYPVSQIDLATIDNPALVHYIMQFYELLKEQLGQIEDGYKSLEPHKTDFSPEIKEARVLFYESCENVFGQLIYYNSLFNSKCNASCRIAPTIAEPDESLMRLANNYFSLVSRLEYIYQSSRTAFYISNIHENVEIQRQINDVAQKNNEVIGRIDKVLKASGVSNIISIALGVVSVILAVWSLILAFDDNHKTTDSNKTEMNKYVNKTNLIKNHVAPDSLFIEDNE